MGSLDHPFNPVSLALGAEATFVARTIDSDRKHLHRGAAARRPRTAGTALVEIYQNCNIFNDGAFDAAQGLRHQRRLADPAASTASRSASAPTGAKGVVRDRRRLGLQVVDVAEVGEDALLVHDAHADEPGDRLRAVPAGRHLDAATTPRSGSSATSPARRTTPWSPTSSTRPAPSRAPATWPT